MRKKGKNTAGWKVLAAVCAIVLTVCGSFFFWWKDLRHAAEAVTCAVLVAGTPDAASQKVMQGAKSAAKKKEATVSLYIWQEDVRSQLIKMKDQDKIQGVICFQEKTDDDSKISEIERLCGQIGLSVLMIGNSEEDSVCNDEEAGRLLVQKALEQGAKSIIFFLLQDDKAALRQLQGARSALPEKISYQEIEYGQQGLSKEDQVKINQEGVFLLAMGETATEVALQMKETGRLPAGLPLLGTGRPMETEALECGAASALLYPSYFTLGYSAFEELCGAEMTQTNSDGIPYRLITLENLYDSENVSYVFSLLD